MESSTMMQLQEPVTARLYLREPILEIAQAARYLDKAVSAHIEGRSNSAEELIRLADIPAIREWTDSLWGKNSPHVQYRSVSDAPPTFTKEQRGKVRMPTLAEKKQLLMRDGHHCRFCGIPLIRKEVREQIRKLFPQVQIWGDKITECHAAFQAMWLQYDHVLPHSRGGKSELENMLITCAPCNYARMSFTLEEVGLADPRTREPIRSTWEGLERIMDIKVSNSGVSTVKSKHSCDEETKKIVPAPFECPEETSQNGIGQINPIIEMHSTWNNEYYENLEFYYWEPQHLGKKKDPDSSVKSLTESVAKLRKMEVSLNHIFNMFFRLCPSVITDHILWKITGYKQLGDVIYQPRQNNQELYGKNVTQADMMLLDDSSVVAIEMKLDSKTSLEQLVKYAMLFAFEKEISGKDKNLHLIYLTKCEFPRMFKEKIVDMDDLTSKFDTTLIPDKTKSGNVELHGIKNEIVDVLKKMNICFITYTEFYNIIREIKDGIDTTERYSDMLISLTDGMLNELESRNLA